MSLLEKLTDSINRVESGADDISSHYKLLWENGFMLKPDQFASILERSRKAGGTDERAASWATFSEGFSFTYFPDRGSAYHKLSDAKSMFDSLGDTEGVGAAQCLLAVYFKNIGQMEQAQDNIQQALLNIGSSSLYRYFKGIGFYQAGEINHVLKDYDLAIRYFEQGMQEIGQEHKGMRARILNGMGTIYADKADLDRAFQCFTESLIMAEGSNNVLLDSKNYADLGHYYFRKGDFANALAYQEKSMEIRKERSLNNPLITNYLELSELHLHLENYDEALRYGLEAVKLAREMNIIIKLYQAHRVLSSVYEAMDNPQQALTHYKQYNQYKDEVLNQESARKIKQLSMHHEVETAQKEKEIFKLRNIELKNALDEIGASVRYARRIQEAILPPESFWKQHLPESFILYKPKDVVAGDFYWMETSGDLILFAVADCTGHGVPGAMVSVVCSTALHRAVKEFSLTDPGKILDKVRELVLRTFEKSESSVNDGMDVSLCVLNNKTNELHFAGANNPAYVIRPTGDVVGLNANKQPIGKSEVQSVFTSTRFQYTAGDLLYMFTDGFADQFGGPNGKKFKRNTLLATLRSIHQLRPEEQLQEINAVFENWRGVLDQVDDVTIAGIRL